MKTLVIYDSAFGNTKLVAESIAKEINADIVHVSDATSQKCKSYELLIVGSPIQGWQPLPAMADFLESIPAKTFSGIKSATFDTRVNLFIHGDATEKMAAKLASAGAEVIGTNYFYVKGQKGPIKPGETERAVAWGKSLS